MAAGPDSNEDFEDVILALTSEKCEFLIVGGFALAMHGAPRATGDLDIFVRPTLENARRVYAALAKFGAPLAIHGVRETDFATPGAVYQMGLRPRRIDILTEISAVTFDEALNETVEGNLGSHPVRCIGLDALIRNKRSTGRLKDLADAETLEAIRATHRRR